MQAGNSGLGFCVIKSSASAFGAQLVVAGVSGLHQFYVDMVWPKFLAVALAGVVLAGAVILAGVIALAGAVASAGAVAFNG